MFKTSVPFGKVHRLGDFKLKSTEPFVKASEYHCITSSNPKIKQ